MTLLFKTETLTLEYIPPSAFAPGFWTDGKIAYDCNSQGFPITFKGEPLSGLLIKSVQ